MINLINYRLFIYYREEKPLFISTKNHNRPFIIYKIPAAIDMMGLLTASSRIDIVIEDKPAD
jgi:hypothetical protein